MSALKHVRSLALAGVALGATAAAAYAVDTVRFLHNETDPPAVEYFNAVIAEFEALHPDIKIEMEAVGTDQRLQKVLATSASRTMPEIIKINAEEKYEFVRRGMLAPVDDVIAEIGTDTYAPGTLIPIDDKLWELPYSMSNGCNFYYRSDLYDAAGLTPPTTWDEVLANAEKLNVGDVNGYVFPAGEAKAATDFFSVLMWSNGGTYFDKDLNVTFNSQATVDALTLIQKLAAFSPPAIGTYSYGDMINSYLTGKVAQDMYLGRLAAALGANTPDLLAVTKVAPGPVGTSGIRVCTTGLNTFAMTTPEFGNKATDAAKQFLVYLFTGDRPARYAMQAFPHIISPQVPPREEAIKQGAALLNGRGSEFAEVAFNNPTRLDFAIEAGAQIVNGEVVLSGVANPYIGSIIGRHIPAQVVQRVVIGGETPEAAAAWGQEQMQAIVDELKAQQ